MELFKEANKKYFPESVKRIKEKEFLEHKQGNKSIAKYEIEFSTHARFGGSDPRDPRQGAWPELLRMA